MPPQNAKEIAAFEIINLFKYTYRHELAPGNIFAGKSRVWVQAFNELVEKGFIERKKTSRGYAYRWLGAFPEVF